MKKQIFLLALTALGLGSCTNDTLPPPSADSSELAVAVNVLSGDATRVLKSTTFSNEDPITVFATYTDYTPLKAIYTYNGTAWSSPSAAAEKIYLSNATASIYAYYPAAAATDPANPIDGTATVITGTLAASEASFAGTGQTDYMYATAADGSIAKASNSATENASESIYDNSVDLNMHHALSKLSFVINKGSSYTGVGTVSSISIGHADAANDPYYGSFTMNVASGALDTGSSSRGDISFTGSATANDYNATPSTVVTATGLAIPVTVTGFQITVTVDGKAMSAPLPALPSSATAWAAGSNYTYALQINGTELSANSVAIEDWNEVDVTSGTPVSFE